jgi:hypothetical protein
MSVQVRGGDIDFVSGQRALTKRLPVKSTIGAIHLYLTGDLVVTVAATLREDGILRLLKRIEVSVGGRRLKAIGDGAAFSGGGVVLHHSNRVLYNEEPYLNQPAVGVATNPFSAMLTIPMEMPPALASQYPSRTVRMAGKADKFVTLNARKLTMLSPTGKDVEIDIDWGAVSDVISAGTATLANVKAEVIIETFPQYDRVQMPLLMHETSKQADLTAGANAREQTRLDRFGIVPFHILMGWDNSIRADSVYNRVNYVINGSNHRIDQTWGSLQANLIRAMGFQAAAFPTGVNAAIFDSEEDGEGMLIVDADDVKEFSLFVDHAALTSTFKILLHQYQIKAQG